jgi:alpha-L-rhamnosidase
LLSAYVLGIRPVEPGFSEAVFDPRPGSLSWAEGVVPTPHGNIRVRWKRGADGVIEDDIEVPRGVTVRSVGSNVRVVRQ